MVDKGDTSAYLYFSPSDQVALEIANFEIVQPGWHYNTSTM